MRFLESLWHEVANSLEDGWDWARGLVGSRPAPTGRSEADLAKDRANIDHLAALARGDRQ